MAKDERIWYDTSRQQHVASELEVGLLAMLDEIRLEKAELQRDLAACQERAERAEHAAAIWEQRAGDATALSGQHLGEVVAALERAERAEAEARELDERLGVLQDLKQDAEAERDAARGERDRLREALLEYGSHRPPCPAYIDAASNCVCGWQVVRGDTRAALESKE